MNRNKSTFGLHVGFFTEIIDPLRNPFVALFLRSGFSDEDCDCHTRCWTRRGDSLSARTSHKR